MSAHLGKVRNKSMIRRNERAYNFFKDLISKQYKEKAEIVLPAGEKFIEQYNQAIKEAVESYGIKTKENTEE